MTYQHTQRLLAHYEPVKKPEGSNLAWGSRERYEKLSPSAVAVALVICAHLNNESNTYEVSNKTIFRETGISKDTITNATNQLVSWGIFTRTRANKERAYRYALVIQCPPDCPQLEIHNTKSELATLPKKQATPLPTEQATPSPTNKATGHPVNRKLIETNKQINKKIDKPISVFCVSCNVEEYLNKKVHQDHCPAFTEFVTGKPWAITQERNSEDWQTWDNQERQRAVIRGLRDLKAKTDSEAQARKRKFDQMVADQADSRTLLPNWRNWLETRVHAFSLTKISRNDLRLALTWSERGTDIPPELEWNVHPHDNPLIWNRWQALAVDLDN